MEDRQSSSRRSSAQYQSSPDSPWRAMVEYLKNILHNTVSLKIREWVKDYCRKNGLLTLSVLAVVTGCVVGFMLRSLNLSTQAKIYFSFPGELLMRMLKMLILPLITSR
ncbi:hypothetical protein AOLI_G00116830 [Acnodon oligacanthus]